MQDKWGNVCVKKGFYIFYKKTKNYVPFKRYLDREKLKI